MAIAPPRREAPDPDRGIDVEFALEPAFQQLTEAAEAAGWSSAEVAAAMYNLALAHIAAKRANEEADQHLRSAVSWRWTGN